MRVFMKTMFMAVVMVLISSLAFTPIASAYAPATGLTFNNPYGSRSQQYRIHTKINDGLRNAPKGSTVRIAMASASVQSYVDAVVKAHKRGVNIRMVMNGVSTGGQAWKTFQRTLGTNAARPSFAVSCLNSCFSTDDSSSQHAKFYTFSQTGTAKKVVMVTSSNQTSTQATVGFNSMYTMSGNSTMYAAYYRYFDAMVASAAKNDNVDYYRTRASGPYRVYFTPSITARQHPWTQLLNNVSCKAKGGYGYKGRTTVRVSMSIWSSYTDGIARKLVDLDNRGCIVEAIISTRVTSTSIQKILLSKTKNGGIEVRNAFKDTNNDGKSDRYMHDKSIAISGGYNGKQAKNVWVGSLNLSVNAFRRNNDVLQKVEGAKPWQQYTDNYVSVKRYAPILKRPTASNYRTTTGASTEAYSDAQLENPGLELVEY